MGRYEAYKDSGVEWIGEIPEGWKVSPIKYIATCNDDTLPEGTDPHYEFDYVDISSVTEGVIGETQRIKFANSPSRARRVVKSGDTIVSTVRTYLKAIARVHDAEDLVASTGFAVLRPRDIEPKFLSYALSNDLFAQEVTANSVGISYPAINASDIVRIPVACPPHCEQSEIADYLDAKTAEIDSLVAETERSVALLREYRKSVISEAVTKGLDPDAPMRVSGVDWIGEIPEGWAIPKIGSITTKIGSGKTPRGGAEIYTESGVPFLRSQNIYNNGLVLDDVAYIPIEIDEEMKSTRVQYGDVLLNITGGSIGRCCVYSLSAHANVNQHVCIIRTDNSADCRWLHYYWVSEFGSRSVSRHQTGANREGLNFDQIASTKIPLPPLDEQRAIADYLDAKTAEIDALIADKERQVELLKEYRKSLISEAVTGKFKVPGLE